VIDGRLMTATLLEDCEQIARHHADIPAPAKATLLADQVASAAHDLRAAMVTARGSGWVLVENELRTELGHDISAGSGS
jgi:hypothetical protein